MASDRGAVCFECLACMLQVYMSKLSLIMKACTDCAVTASQPVRRLLVLLALQSTIGIDMRMDGKMRVIKSRARFPFIRLAMQCVCTVCCAEKTGLTACGANNRNQLDRAILMKRALESR